MKPWFFGSLVALAVMLPVLTPAAVQDAPAMKRPVPRLSSGQPDLQAVWSFAIPIPLERPTSSDDERRPRRVDAIPEHERGRPINGELPPIGNYNAFWFDQGPPVVADRRTSLIVDPPDGKVPPLTAEGSKKASARRAALERPPSGPEDRSVAERCILGFNAGPPMNPGAYNNNVQLFQTRDTVVIVNEMVHNARIIPLDGRPHLPSGVRQWSGDSRGHWEGDTLVVETTNFTDKTSWRGSGDEMRLTERFTRVDVDTLLYEYTVDDPTMFTKPWTARIAMPRTMDRIFEYACHEGNHGMIGILSGARALENRSAEGTSKR